MKHSEAIGNLALALSKAQGQMKHAMKSSKSQYGKHPGLDDVWDACRKPLADNELAFIQTPHDGENCKVLTSMLIHSSGEWTSSTLTLVENAVVRNAAHGLAGAITYFRRYAMTAILGLAPGEEDDGNRAQDLEVPEHLKDMAAAMDNAETLEELAEKAPEKGSLEGAEREVMKRIYNANKQRLSKVKTFSFNK